MDTDPKSSSDIKETDIIFDCPHCGKSLAIDYRGAGLSIKCSDCGNDVQVPIPDGMEIEDIDSTTEEQETRIMHLRKSLSIAQERIQVLEDDVHELTSRRESLEKGRSESMYKVGQVLEKAGIIEDVLKTAVAAISDVTELCGDDDS
jgi:predicted  nucleic acid-binding Zn-ribbon protein